MVLHLVLLQNILTFYTQWYRYWETIKIPRLFTNMRTHTAAVAAARAAQWLSQGVFLISEEKVKVKVKKSHYRSGVAQRVPGS
jgi:hypothetical protein